jgi:hypothetical protein
MNSKAKGGKFERDICKALSHWVSNHKRDDLFWRSAMSGGRSTVAAKSGKKLNAQCGDITSVDPMGNSLTDWCYFECKHLRKCSLDDLVKRNYGKGSLLAIWHKTRHEALRYDDRNPVLIFRQNLWPTVLCTDGTGIDFFDAEDLVFAAAPPHHMYFVRFDDLMAVRFNLKWKAVPGERR